MDQTNQPKALSALRGSRGLSEIEANSGNHPKHTIQQILHHQRLRVVKVQGELRVLSIHYSSISPIQTNDDNKRKERDAARIEQNEKNAENDAFR